MIQFSYCQNISMIIMKLLWTINNTNGTIFSGSLLQQNTITNELFFSILDHRCCLKKDEN